VLFYNVVKHCLLPFFVSSGRFQVISFSLLSCLHFLDDMAETQPSRVLILGHSLFLVSRYSFSFLRNLQLSENLHIRWQGIGGRTVSKVVKYNQDFSPSFNKQVKLLTQFLRVVLEPLPYVILWVLEFKTHFFASDGVHLNSLISSV